MHSLVSLSGDDVVMCWGWIVGDCRVLGWLVVVGPAGHLWTFHGVMTSKSGLGDPWARCASPAVGRARVSNNFLLVHRVFLGLAFEWSVRIEKCAGPVP